VLDGGSGKDVLTGSIHDDDLIGGSSADTFRFHLGQDQGSDRLTGFERKLDVLSFNGLTAKETKGLVNDLDAISTIVDQGSGQDVVVSFDIGTRITFVGLGTGHVDSWADLVVNPAKQLILDPAIA
jgi:serralysin